MKRKTRREARDERRGGLLARGIQKKANIGTAHAVQVNAPKASVGKDDSERPIPEGPVVS
jgi:hypothetical protein